MIWRTDKPKGSPIVVYRNGNPRPEVLFLATKPYPHYYDDGGEEIPDGMIQKWASLEESSLPSNLDEVAVQYQINTRGPKVIGGILSHEEFIRFNTNYDFKAGAQWDREQMMSKAVEGEITKDNRGNNVVRAGVFNKDFEYGDKVRIIIVNED